MSRLERHARLNPRKPGSVAKSRLASLDFQNGKYDFQTSRIADLTTIFGANGVGAATYDPSKIVAGTGLVSGAYFGIIGPLLTLVLAGTTAVIDFMNTADAGAANLILWQLQDSTDNLEYGLTGDASGRLNMYNYNDILAGYINQATGQLQKNRNVLAITLAEKQKLMISLNGAGVLEIIPPLSLLTLSLATLRVVSANLSIQKIDFYRATFNDRILQQLCAL